jgi:hypothetical protein
MIKCNATIRGVVSRAAMPRTDKDGKHVASFAVKTVVSGKPENKEVEIFVSHPDMALCNSLEVGTRVELKGELTFRKKGEVMYLNFIATNVDPTNEPDVIDGTMEFKGTVGKQIDMKTDKNGGKYLTFSAYSAEKVGADFEYIWVRFVRFSADREEFLQPKTKIAANGTLELSAYQGNLSLSCRLEQLTERQPMPFYPTNEKPPF